jgi:transglutaminase-like putative cysteine protease
LRLATGILAAALLLWGWHNALLLVAVPLAIIIELPRWTPWRWDLSDKDFQRLADASTVGFILLAAYQFDAHGASGIYAILRWLPVALFPLVATQVYSTRDRVDYTALFWSVRAAVARGNISDPGGADIRLTFVVVCMVSASGGAAHAALLLPSMAALMAWILWSNRPRRYAGAHWAVALALGVGLCFLLKTGTLQARRFIEPLAMSYLQDRIAARGDPYRAYTAIGQIGQLKLSDRIVLRVEPGPNGEKPQLLHQASYQTFARNMWVSRRTRFEELRSSAVGTAWHIAEEPAHMASVCIATYLRNGKGLLAVPGGTRRLDNLPVDGVYRNGLGALKVLEGPEVVNFRAHYVPLKLTDAAPDAADLIVPKAHQKLFTDLVARLRVDGDDDRLMVERVRRFFARNFSYTLDLQSPRGQATPLEDFLLERRSGHCEYFATSTVLLLRAAGIPARYATGYSVQEYSEIEERYLVRRRHAHSWVLAWVNGAWRDVDTTPAVWGALESAQASWWQPVYDVGSWLAFLFAEWRWEETEETERSWMLWLVLPLLGILIWRMARRQRIRRGRRTNGAENEQVVRQGADSAFFAIEQRLVGAGHERRSGECSTSWIRRLAQSGALPDAAVLIRDILPLHYRYRFHPAGLDEDGRRALASRVREWLARNPAKRT